MQSKRNLNVVLLTELMVNFGMARVRLQVLRTTNLRDRFDSRNHAPISHFLPIRLHLSLRHLREQLIFGFLDGC